jgi:hypothetical protein
MVIILRSPLPFHIRQCNFADETWELRGLREETTEPRSTPFFVGLAIAFLKVHG